MSRGMARASRLRRMEELLISAPEGYTIRELAEKLDVHRTTIWRDLNEISREAPVQQVGHRYLIDRMAYLSSVRLSCGESLMLYLAMRRMIRRPSHIPPMMVMALEKLTHAIRHPAARQLAESIQAMQTEQPTDPERARIWETLVQAWMERITVRITYQAYRRSVLHVYEVQPYLFEPAVLSEGVYLIGHSLTHNALRTFKVEQITRAVLTTQRFVRPEDMVADRMLRHLWGFWHGKELSEVRLRFRDPAVGRRVRRTIWLPSQRVVDLPDGGVEWSAPVADVLELVPWIRGWGPDCEVLAPAELQETIAEVEQYMGGVIMTTTETPRSAAFSQAFYASLQDIVDGERIRACQQCGACSGICPFGHFMVFPTRRMIAALRADVIDSVMDTDTVWMCVSCYACTEVCPSEIPLTTGLMTRTKEEMLLAGNIPTELQDALENSQRYGNPLGESPRKRAAWTTGLEPEVAILGKVGRPVDVLWFVGDYASYHPRVQRVSRALARVFNALEVDFGILGPEETSDGDTQRLAGERGLFEILAEKNGQAFRKYEFDTIVTSDPHAYNALKNEYPSLGISYPVRHYTQFLAERLDHLRPLLTQEVEAKITYHDPCYLGRVNGVYEEPRELLRAIPGVELVEMSHSAANSLCCGGGGGGMWLDGFQWEKSHVRLSDWRVREAVACGADILAVSCPYETPRFEDAAKMVEDAGRLVVKDIAELLSEAMGDVE